MDRKVLLKLGDPDSVVAGKCFFITDGSPTSGLFLISAFNTAITGEECYRPTVILPKWVSFCLAKYFTLRSRWLGKQFWLPFWGFTIMEAYKVRK